ncbi:NDP-hexose 2,3-dehydratase family protein [Microcella humidisoli]|uniref:NDP-hexose 2,3-dehydratase family protein n=1 Tax=Microcella humidisoli TaxID=2963406 RepID=A0ABY5FUJ2_9MICO|nr:NDP-hexose 2,3-dehydratase family protein [Microcella humidisoli]UTT61974.1 NDP-hexose 2,3-dehydratase family protein [Microcella humidisoli]
MTTERARVSDWLATVADSAELEVTPARLSDSTDWAVRDGAIRHRSDRFFRVVGVRTAQGDQPLLEQREIGTLGFLCRGDARREVLVHAKVEPGNVGGAQLAPTVQATASNADRVHGGAAPPFSREFASDAVRLRSRVLGSEQGTRFAGKLNANVIAEAVAVLDHGAAHRWMPVDEILDLLAHDWLVNTDARSVLVTASWPALLGREPFTRHRDAWSARLAASLRATDDVHAVTESLLAARRAAAAPQWIAVDALDGWRLDDIGITPLASGPFHVRHIAVRCWGREVERWDQPIIDSVDDGLVEVWVDDRGPHPLFGLTPVTEPGLLHRVELTATRVRAPGERSREAPTAGEVIAAVHQSDEGGRFLHDRSRYALVRVDDPSSAPEGTLWLSLAQLVVLMREGEWTTNEARSALSLLLPWL